MVFAGVLIGWILIIANGSIVDSDNLEVKFAVLTLIIAFSFNWRTSIKTSDHSTLHTSANTSPTDPVHGSWIALNAKSPGERSISMAIFIMGANVSGIVSGQLFQAEDAPRYKTAWTVTMAMSSAGVVSALWTNAQYWWLNRRNTKKGDTSFVYTT